MEMNIYQKLAGVRDIVGGALKKNKSGYNYKYVTEDEVLAKVTAGLKKYRLFLKPRLCPGETKVIPYHTEKVKFTKTGEKYAENVDEVLVVSDMVWDFVNIDNPEEMVSTPWTIVGQQANASMAFGSGLSYTLRYFLLKFFNIATVEDDVDGYKRKQKEAEQAQEAERLKSLTEGIDEAVKEYTAGGEENTKTITKLLKSIIKIDGKPSANYFKIKDLETAIAVKTAVDALKEEK